MSLVGLVGCRSPANEFLEKAQLALFDKKPQDALVHYRRALELLENNDSSRANVLRARALKGAADVYYLELRDIPKAAKLYRELAAACPKAPETIEGRILLSDILHHHYRDLPGAIRELSQAVSQNPPQSAQLRYRMAKMYFELGDYSQCELEAGKILDSYSSSDFADDALFLRGQALSMMEGRRQQALSAFSQLLDEMKESSLRSYALFERGKLLEADGQNEKAIEVWIEALATHPDPQMIQGVIARARKRLQATTPDWVGERNKAFSHSNKAELPKKQPPITLTPPAPSSVEAAGGTAIEAEVERKQKNPL